MKLIETSMDQQVTVKGFTGGSNLVSKLYKLGIKEGVSVKIKKKSNICPILLEINGSTVAIGRGMAAKTIVEEEKE